MQNKISNSNSDGNKITTQKDKNTHKNPRKKANKKPKNPDKPPKDLSLWFKGKTPNPNSLIQSLFSYSVSKKKFVHLFLNEIQSSKSFGYYVPAQITQGMKIRDWSQLGKTSLVCTCFYNCFMEDIKCRFFPNAPLCPKSCCQTKTPCREHFLYTPGKGIFGHFYQQKNWVTTPFKNGGWNAHVMSLIFTQSL